MTEIRGDKILVAGFGREGKSAHAYLRKHFPWLEIVIADQNPEALKGIYYRSYSGKNYLKEIDKFDTVIKSPGIPPTEIVKKAKHVTSLTNIFFESCPGKIVGITGTKGKSTTSSLIAHILATSKKDVRLIGNVGNPALDYLEGATSDTVFVMELSSYQLMDVHYSPHVAVLLPIYEEHLNYHGSMKNYVSAKANITKFQSVNDYLLYYEGNDYCKGIASDSSATKVSFRKFIGDTSLPGEANQIIAALQSFKPLPHRLENIGVYQGIEFVNDSLATIPEATIHALEAFEGKVETLIAGGFDRGINFLNLGPEITRSGVKTLILFPDTGKKIEQSLPKNNIKVFHTKSMKQAVKLAYAHTSRGKVCLMSPASTSFNLFKDYEDRGNQFKKYVQTLSDFDK